MKKKEITSGIFGVVGICVGVVVVKKIRDFRNSNTAILGVPPIWPHFEALEISIMMLYLDDTFSLGPKMLGVNAHLYRLLSPKI